ncbi:MAG TPA: PEP-CTERM sorting domain-containing protein [Pirellulaceae bacterium]|nr:PEP-CTERM sorting domain-containing protein [Pirellulaceae bacterium]HMP71427.1 PEP-CTERM sorting domain-containing protein [Pirellulaceae bacterium]
MLNLDRGKITLVVANFIIALQVMTVGSLFAQTTSFWDGTDGGYWTNSAHWSHGIPMGDFNAVVNAGRVVQNGAEANLYDIQRLALGGGTVEMGFNGSTTTNLNATGVGNWALEWHSGMIRRSNNTSVVSTQADSYSILTSSGLKELSGGVEIQSRGYVNWSGGDLSGTWGIGGSPVWRNLEGVFSVQGDLAMTADNFQSVFDNQSNATYWKTAGNGTHSVQWVFDNRGTLYVDRGTINLQNGSNHFGGVTYLDPYHAGLSAALEFSGGNPFVFGDGSINGFSNSVFRIQGASTEVKAGQDMSVNVPLEAYYSHTGSGNTRTLGSSFSADSYLSFYGPSVITNHGGTGTFLQVGGVGQLSFVDLDLYGTADGGITTFRNTTFNGQTTWHSGRLAASGSGGVGTTAVTNDGQFDIAAMNAVFRDGGAGGKQFVNVAVGGSNSMRVLDGVGTATFELTLVNQGTIRIGDSTLRVHSNKFEQATWGNVILEQSSSVLELMSSTGTFYGGFEGNGTIRASSIELADGWIRPGTSTGTLTFDSDLHLGHASFLFFELGTQSDLIVVNGDFTLDGSLYVDALAGFGVGDYLLVDYSGSFVDHGLWIESVPGGFSYSISHDAVLGHVYLTVAAVPEPSSIALLGGFLLMAIFRRSPMRPANRASKLGH